MANELILDAPELNNDAVDAVDEVVEQSGDDVQAEPLVEAVAEDVKGDDRTLPQWIKNLREASPEAFKDARAMWFDRRGLHEKTKGLDLDKMTPWLTEHGGIDGIEARTAELTAKGEELEGLYAAIQAGDAALPSRIAQTYPEGFSKLVPAMNSEWAKVDPDGWAHSMSSIMAATIDKAAVPLFLERMGLMLEFGKYDDLKEALPTLKGWVESFAKTASTPIQRADPQKPQGDDKLKAAEEKLANIERTTFENNLTSKVETTRKADIASSIQTYLDKGKDDPDFAEKSELVIANITNAVLSQMNQDKDFVSKVNALKAKGDADGAAKLIASREKAVINEIGPKKARLVFGQVSTPKPPPVVAKPKAAAKPTFQKPADKWDEIYASA